jgi:site-specific DNA-methyltransferase (adenine-specific)
MTKRKAKTAAQKPQNLAPTWQMLCGESKKVLEQFPDNYFDSVVTDPPYSLSSETLDTQSVIKVMQSWLGNGSAQFTERGYGNEAWDVMPGPETWKQVYRVMKPGSYLAAFSASRTDDLLKMALRLSGFEVVDTIAYVYRNGFPKAVDIGRALEKRLRTWGHQPPQSHNDSVRVQTELSGSSYVKSLKRQVKRPQTEQVVLEPSHELSQKWADYHTHLKPSYQPIVIARKPHGGTTLDNIIVNGTGALNIGKCRLPRNDNTTAKVELGRYPANVVGDLGADNDNWFFNPYNVISNRPTQADKDVYLPLGVMNDHITPKPIALMEWLTRLVTPTRGKVLDPFTGSGSTGISALHEGFEFVGVELDAHYHEIASLRLANCETATNG